MNPVLWVLFRGETKRRLDKPAQDKNAKFPTPHAQIFVGKDNAKLSRPSGVICGGGGRPDIQGYLAHKKTPTPLGPP